MNLQTILEELYLERERLGRTIAALEELASPESPQVHDRRGRKSMGAAERLEVSERMKKYWANRRKGRTTR
jgi:hypothetical protein